MERKKLPIALKKPERKNPLGSVNDSGLFWTFLLARCDSACAEPAATRYASGRLEERESDAKK